MTTLILSVFFSISASAYDVEVDGIYYNLISKGNAAEVTKGDKEYSGDITIPSTIIVNDVEYQVKGIENRAFYRCSGLTSISIPNSVTRIDESSFSGCSGLTSVTIPNSVTNIEDEAFYGCSGLTSVTIPNSVTSIGEYAFYDCNNLTSVTIPNSVIRIEDGTFAGCNNLTSITIPNSVTSIGVSAFYGCSGLTSVSIPNSVTSIGVSAFSFCIGLTSVSIPNSVTSIGDYAFSDCSGLTSFTIPNSVTSIGKRVFQNCRNLTSFTIPNPVRSIGDYAFSGCIGLTSVSIPNSVTSIGEGIFSSCSNLTSVTIPNSVISIGKKAFQYCIGLTSVSIPNSVTSIGDYAFSDCSGLTSITIPNSVTSIESEAFANCSKLENVYCYAESFSEIYEDIFKESYIKYATLYVPSSAITYFQTTKPWSGFGTIKTIEGTDVETKKCATPSISYSDGQLQFTCDTEGAKCYYTLNNSDVKTGETLAESNNVNLSACYDITCYAKAEGFVNSDVATAKLYWLTSSGSLEGAGINNVSMRGIAIQSADGFINISGLDNNEKVSFYGIDGKSLGSATAINGTTSFAAQSGSIVVVKIGKESIKVSVK